MFWIQNSLESTHSCTWPRAQLPARSAHGRQLLPELRFHAGASTDSSQALFAGCSLVRAPECSRPLQGVLRTGADSGQNMIERVEVVRGGSSGPSTAHRPSAAPSTLSLEPTGNSAEVNSLMMSIGGRNRFDNNTTVNASRRHGRRETTRPVSMSTGKTATGRATTTTRRQLHRDAQPADEDHWPELLSAVDRPPSSRCNITG